MTRKWQTVLAILLLFGACRKTKVLLSGRVLTKPHPGQQEQSPVDEALRVQPRTSDGWTRTEQPPKTARADEALKTEMANEGAFQQKSAAKPFDARRRHRHSSGKASATRAKGGIPVRIHPSVAEYRKGEQIRQTRRAVTGGRLFGIHQ